MVSEGDYSDFLDLAYGAAVEPDQWASVIARFADLMGGEKAWLSSLNIRDGTGDGVIARIDPAAQETYFGYYGSRNPFLSIGGPADSSHWPLNVVADEAVMPKADLVRTEYYNDFLRPQDIHSAAIVRLSRTDGYVTTLNVTRSRRREQFERSDCATGELLQPHLVRALQVSRALASQRSYADSLAEVLDRSLHGFFLLDGDGRLRHVNRAGERLLGGPHGLRVLAGRLTVAAQEPARRLMNLIARAGTRDGARRGGGSMALATVGRSIPLALTVAPLRTGWAAAAIGPSILVCVSDPEIEPKLETRRLREVFGLTAAESRIAIALFEGLSLRDIADATGVSFETVRNQLRSVFEKTGVNRQAALVGLLTRSIFARLD